MSKFSKFMKANKAEKKNEMYAATKSLCDENGKPLEWEFRHITSKENESLRDDCTIDIPITGKPNMFRPKVQSGKYIQKMITAFVVMPDLYDAELQDSYFLCQRVVPIQRISSNKEYKYLPYYSKNSHLPLDIEKILQLNFYLID